MATSRIERAVDNFVETLSIRSRTNANQYFSALKIPTTEQTFTSDNKIVQLKNGDMITAYEAFERLNKQVLSEYVKNDIAGRRFILFVIGAIADAKVSVSCPT